MHVFSIPWFPIKQVAKKHPWPYMLVLEHTPGYPHAVSGLTNFPGWTRTPIPERKTGKTGY